MIRRELVAAEKAGDVDLYHDLQPPIRPLSMYGYNDYQMLHDGAVPEPTPVSSVHSLDYLLEKDSQRREIKNSASNSRTSSRTRQRAIHNRTNSRTSSSRRGSKRTISNRM